MYQPERSNELLGSRNLKEKLYRRNGNMRMGSVKQVQLINQSLTLRLQAVSIIFFPNMINKYFESCIVGNSTTFK